MMNKTHATLSPHELDAHMGYARNQRGATMVGYFQKLVAFLSSAFQKNRLDR